MIMSQHKEFLTDLLNWTFLWDLWLGRDATSRNIDEIQTLHIKMAALVTKVGDTNLKIHHQ